MPANAVGSPLWPRTLQTDEWNMRNVGNWLGMSMATARRASQELTTESNLPQQSLLNGGRVRRSVSRRPRRHRQGPAAVVKLRGANHRAPVTPCPFRRSRSVPPSHRAALASRASLADKSGHRKPAGAGRVMRTTESDDSKPSISKIGSPTTTVMSVTLWRRDASRSARSVPPWSRPSQTTSPAPARPPPAAASTGDCGSA